MPLSAMKIIWVTFVAMSWWLLLILLITWFLRLRKPFIFPHTLLAFLLHIWRFESTWTSRCWQFLYWGKFDSLQLLWVCLFAPWLREGLCFSKHSALYQKSLYNAWVATLKLRRSVASKRAEIQLLQRSLKLHTILKGQVWFFIHWVIHLSVSPIHMSVFLYCIHIFRNPFSTSKVEFY